MISPNEVRIGNHIILSIPTTATIKVTELRKELDQIMSDDPVYKKHKANSMLLFNALMIAITVSFSHLLTSDLNFLLEHGSSG